MISKAIHSTLITLCCCVLVACGGGGGGSSTSLQSQAQTRQPNLCEQMPAQSNHQIQLLSATGVNNYRQSGNAIADLNSFTNSMRLELGLPELSLNAEVATAAAAHSNYMAVNQTLTHYETTGLPGFSAISPFDRIDLAYQGTLTYSGEIVSSMSGRGTSADSAIRALFDAPLHRVVMLSEYAFIGSGYSSSSAGVAYTTQDYANYQASIADFALVAYPYANANNIQTTWQDTETPDPLEGTPFKGGTVGYPITLQGNLGSKLTLGQLKVYANCESEVALTTRSYDTDPTIVHSENVLVAVPHLRLSPNTRYTVWATGYYTSSAKTMQPFDVRWSFTTQ